MRMSPLMIWSRATRGRGKANSKTPLHQLKNISKHSVEYVYNVLMYFGKDTSYNPDLDPDSGDAVKNVEYLLVLFSKVLGN